LDIIAPGGEEIASFEDAARENRALSTFVLTGTVLWFHWAGYGCIATDSDIDWPQALPAGSQVFVSREELTVAPGSVCALSEGMRVQFRVFEPPDQTVAAAEVTAIGGEPLVCAAQPATWSYKGGIKGRGKAARATMKGQAPVIRVQKTIHKVPIVTSSRGIIPKAAVVAAEGQVPCKFFAEGKCTRGAACHFAHVRSVPQSLDFAAAQAAAPYPDEGGRRARSVPCKFFAERRCQKGALCGFSHDTPAVATPAIISEKIPQECTFFARGYCMRGQACRYAHGPQELYELMQATGDPTDAQVV